MLYLKVNETSGDLVFQRDIHSLVPFPPSLDLDMDFFNLYNCKSWAYKPKTNDICLFPSVVMHAADPNESDEERWCLAFNVFVRGNIGGAAQAQHSMTRARCASSSTVHPRLFVLTGAGCSTDSGIPDYRDADGEWKRGRPVMLQAFIGDELARKRYWARSLVGWRRMRAAQPERRASRAGRLEARAASRSSSRRTSTACTRRPAAATSSTCTAASTSCAAWAASGACRARRCKQSCVRAIPRFAALEARARAGRRRRRSNGVDFAGFDVPACAACGGMLKPDVVFFGESVPRERVQRAYAALERRRRHAGRRLVADGVLGLPVRAERWPTPASRSRRSTSDARVPTICSR